MRRSPIWVDLTIAIVAAAAVLIISPGPAVDAMLALVVLAACGTSYGIGRQRGHGDRSISGYRESKAVGHRRGRRR